MDAKEPITHRWNVGRRPLALRIWRAIAPLLSPVPQAPTKALNARWEECASWMGLAGAAVCLASHGTSVLSKGLSLRTAERMVVLLLQSGAAEVLTYWAVRSPLWFGGFMYLLCRARE